MGTLYMNRLPNVIRLSIRDNIRGYDEYDKDDVFQCTWEIFDILIDMIDENSTYNVYLFSLSSDMWEVQIYNHHSLYLGYYLISIESTGDVFEYKIKKGSEIIEKINYIRSKWEEEST